MADRKAKATTRQIDFIVTTADPSDVSSSKANKKRVRSVAALKSWPERRKKMFQELEDAGTGHGAFLIDKSVAEPQPAESEITASRPWAERRTKAFQQIEDSSNNAFTHADLLIERPEQQARGMQPLARSTYEWNDTSAHIAAPPRVPPGFTDASPRFIPYGPLPNRTTQLGDHQANTATNIDFAPEAAGSSISLYRSAAAKLLSTQPPRPEIYDFDSMMGPGSNTHVPAQASKKKRMANGIDKESLHGSGSMAILTPPSSPHADAVRGRADPFNCYAVQWQPWFDKILHHMMTIYAPRGWPALRISQSEGMQWEWFLTQNALSEPALFYVRLLFGSGDLIRLGGLSPHIMFWLRARAIASINDALSDPGRSCSDALILAVGRIAMHEHMYGDTEMSVAIHRPAQKRMIDLRGGMRGLREFPEVVKRLMRWSDQVMAVGTGTERMLDDDVRERKFTLRESVKAIEKWAPHEMSRVRTKIKVEDLLNDEGEDVGR